MFSNIPKSNKLLQGIVRKLVVFLKDNQVSYSRIQHKSSFLNRKAVKPIHQIRVYVDDGEAVDTFRSRLLRKLSNEKVFANSSYLTTESVEKRLKKGKVDGSSMGHVLFESGENRVVITLRSTNNSFHRAKTFESYILRKFKAICGTSVGGSRYGSIVENFRGDKKESVEFLLKKDIISDMGISLLKNVLVNTVSDATVSFGNRVYCLSVKELTEKTVRIANFNLRKSDSKKRVLELLSSNAHILNLVRNSYRKNYIFCIRAKRKLYLYKFDGFGENLKISNKKTEKNGVSFDLNGIPCKILIRKDVHKGVWKMELVVRVNDVDGYCKSLGCKKIGDRLEDILENKRWSSFGV